MRFWLLCVLVLLFLCVLIDARPDVGEFVSGVQEKIKGAWNKFIKVLKGPVKIKRLGNTGRTKTFKRFKTTTPLSTTRFNNFDITTSSPKNNYYSRSSTRKFKYWSDPHFYKKALSEVSLIITKRSKSAKLAHTETTYYPVYTTQALIIPNQSDDTTSLARREVLEIPILYEPMTSTETEKATLYNDDIKIVKEEILYYKKSMSTEHHNTRTTSDVENKDGLILI